MLSFYPGPSKLRPNVGRYMSEAIDSGILSYNHRSPEFGDVVSATAAVLRSKLSIPKDYEVYFVSSATECWQVISQSLTLSESTHYYNGAFGQRWLESNKLLGIPAVGLPYEYDAALAVIESVNEDLICVTNCETSNGSYVNTATISKIRKTNPQAIIAVDATSCMAGVYLDFLLADVWFASVQKCFGLPAGLAIMVCSPSAVERAKELNRLSYFNNFIKLHTNMQAFQTTNTPNMLGIYLLGKVMEDALPICEEALLTKQKAKQLRDYFRNHASCKLLIEDDELASDTVIVVKSNVEDILKIKSNAKLNGLLLGNGYGRWAKDNFRIANFPAHTKADMDSLIHFFDNYL